MLVMFSAGPRGLDLCTKAVMPKAWGHLMSQTKILSFTALPTAPPPSRCQFASFYQGFPFQVIFWIKCAVCSIQGSRFSHYGSVRVQGSPPASWSPRTTEKVAMWSFKLVSKGTLLKFRFSQCWLLFWVAIEADWAEEWLKEDWSFPRLPLLPLDLHALLSPVSCCCVLSVCLLGLLPLPHHL